MSALLFDRVVTLDAGIAGQTGVHIEGLRISFSLEKSLSKTSNRLNVDVYNLKADTRRQLELPDSTIILSAGYREAGGAKLLFQGDVVHVHHRFDEAPDIISHIEAEDSAKALRTKISLSYKAGQKAIYILEDIVAALKQSTPITLSQSSDLQNRAFNNGFSFCGLAWEALDKIAVFLSAEWSFQDGVLQILPKGGINQDEAVLLSPESGLIGSPERIIDAGGTLDPDVNAVENTVIVLGYQKKVDAWRLNSLLRPEIIPGATVVVRSRELNDALLRVEKINHKGDSHEGEFVSRIEATVL